MSARLLRYRRNQASLNVPVISSPGYGSVYVYGASVAVSISAPQFFGQSITGSVIQVSTSSSMVNPATYNQSYAGTTLKYLSGLSRGATYYIRCALVGSMTGQTDWSQVVQITILSAAIGDAWMYTSVGNGTFYPPVAGTYRIEIVAGGGGGAIYYGTNYNPTGGGGAGGYVINTSYLSGGVSYTVGGGGGGSAVSWPGGESVAGNGGNTSCNGMTAYGGGGGRSFIYNSPGGGGGGAGGTVTNGGGGGGSSGGASAMSPYGNGGGIPQNGNAGAIRFTLISI